jgi:hypothetical protein
VRSIRLVVLMNETVKTSQKEDIEKTLRRISGQLTEAVNSAKEAREHKLLNLRRSMDLFHSLASKKLGSGELDPSVKVIYNELYCHARELRDPSELLTNYRRDHEFLSQQIDERSHQVFTLGALFVPSSFLIFLQAIIFNVASPHSLLLMGASLTCYFTWFAMYLRTNKLNEASYPLIHALELTLGLSAHLALNEIRKKYWITRVRQQPFYIALNVLIALWAAFLLYPSADAAKAAFALTAVVAMSIALSFALLPSVTPLGMFLVSATTLATSDVFLSGPLPINFTLIPVIEYVLISLALPISLTFATVRVGKREVNIKGLILNLGVPISLIMLPYFSLPLQIPGISLTEYSFLFSTPLLLSLTLSPIKTAEKKFKAKNMVTRSIIMILASAIPIYLLLSVGITVVSLAAINTLLYTLLRLAQYLPQLARRSSGYLKKWIGTRRK